MATQEKTWNVANRLHSLKDSDNPEVNHIIAGSDEIYDDTKGAKQSDINAQTETALADRYTKAETYSKEQLDSLITTPDVNYVSVVATNATTAVTGVLPATGEADTIYRVSNWNGTQYDPTMYALFAWNGSTYVCLAVRSFVGEVYDISANHPDGQGNPTPYARLAAALGTNGKNIPADICRGGMSIKFIQSSDNKYVQFRLMSPTWSTTVANWQGVDDEPIAGSENLVKSGGVEKYLATKKVSKVDNPEYTLGKVRQNGTIEEDSDYGYVAPIPLANSNIIILNQGNDFYHVHYAALVYQCDSEGNYIRTLLVGDGTIKSDSYQNTSGNDIYIGICASTNNLKYIISAYDKAASNTELQETKEEIGNVAFLSGQKVNETSIATGSDFDNLDDTKRAKLTTVGSIIDGSDDTPHMTYDKPIKSKAVYKAISPINSILAELNVSCKSSLVLPQNNARTISAPFTLYANKTYKFLVTASVNNVDTYCFLNGFLKDDNSVQLLAFTLSGGSLSKTITYTPAEDILNFQLGATTAEAKTLDIEVSVNDNPVLEITNLKTGQSELINDVTEIDNIVGITNLSDSVVDWNNLTLYKGIISEQHQSGTNYDSSNYYGNSYQVPVTGCSYVLITAGTYDTQYAFLKAEMTYKSGQAYETLLYDDIYCAGVDGYSIIQANKSALFKVPSDANFIYIRNNSTKPGQYSVLPQKVTIYIGIDRILALENQYNDIDGKITSKLKSFSELYKPQLNWVANALDDIGNWSKNFRFIKVSDIHGNFINMDNAKNIQTFFNRTTIPTFVTGDICYGNPKKNGVVSTEVATYVEKAKACKAYLCAGQHECGFSNPGVGIDGTKKANTFTHQEFVDHFITPMLSTWNLPAGEGTNPYYYQDFDTVRVISLYQFNIPLVDDPNDSTKWKYPRERVWYGQTQLDWFAGVLNSTPSTYKVIVMMHCPDGQLTLISNKFNVVTAVDTVDLIIDGSPIFDIVEAFVNKTTINRHYVCSDTTKFPTDTFYLDAAYDFTSANGTFMFYLGGDFHVDYIGKPVGKQQLYIGMTSGESPYDTSVNKNKDNVQYNCVVDCCGVNFTKKSVYIARLGQTASALGTDRSFDVVEY